MLILNFATFRSFKKFEIDIRMRSQSVERFKQIVQQTFEKLNFKNFELSHR